MFSLEKIPFGPFEQYVLMARDGQTALKVVPEVGANATQIVLNGRPILDGYDTPGQLQVAKGGKSTVLFPFPNRLRDGQYEWFGQAYTFPINNQATENAIHGFVRKEIFEVDRVVLARHFASIICTYHYSGKHAHYPFPFQLDLEFSIYNRGKFQLQATVRNLNHFDIPVGFGWHPYFKLAPTANEHQLMLPPCEQVLVDERMIPSGKREGYNAFSSIRPLGDTQLDTCFAYTGKEKEYALRLEGEQSKLQLNLSAEAFPFFQIFTPDDRKSIALEPMSCNVNALQNEEGLVRLAPNATWQATIEIEATA